VFLRAVSLLGINMVISSRDCEHFAEKIHPHRRKISAITKVWALDCRTQEICTLVQRERLGQFIAPYALVSVVVTARGSPVSRDALLANHLALHEAARISSDLNDHLTINRGEVT
jgi:hypothetical protein